jgi:hypothetical protein
MEHKQLMEAQDAIYTASKVLLVDAPELCPWCYANNLTLVEQKHFISVVCGVGLCRFNVQIRKRRETSS